MDSLLLPEIEGQNCAMKKSCGETPQGQQHANIWQKYLVFMSVFMVSLRVASGSVLDSLSWANLKFLPIFLLLAGAF